MKKIIRRLLFEAYRRNEQAKAKNDDKIHQPIENRWLGLGTAAAYREGIDAGLFVFHDGRTPPPRCMGWLVLTKAGITAMNSMEDEFKEILKRMKARGYDSTLHANYMLAGGLAKR